MKGYRKEYTAPGSPRINLNTVSGDRGISKSSGLKTRSWQKKIHKIKSVSKGHNEIPSKKTLTFHSHTPSLTTNISP